MAKEDLLTILDTLVEEYVWDAVTIQEGLRGAQQGTSRKNVWVTAGPAKGKGNHHVIVVAPT